MAGAFRFRDERLVAGTIGPAVTVAQIAQAVPERFAGKEAFGAFHASFNGAHFPGGALFARRRFVLVAAGDQDELAVDSFFFVPRFHGEAHDFLVSTVHFRENMARRRPDLRAFVAAHLPVASDGSGNDFWIELATGRVKYRAHEAFEDARDLMDVAPTFLDFASNLEARPVMRRGRSLSDPGATKF